MAPATRCVRLRSLLREEFRALPRNTFALAAIAAVFGVLSIPISFFYGGEMGLKDTLLFTWLVLPLVVAILVASRVASARRSRFVDSLYTTPLKQSTWFAAQAIVGATLGILALALQIPFLLVFIAWLGVPAILPAAMLAALGVVAFAVVLGLFCGVIVGDSSPLAAAGLAGGISFMSFVLLILHSVVLGSPPTVERDLLIRITSISPLVLAADASGLGIMGMMPAEPWRPIAGLLALTAGLAGAAWLAYTRAQGPLGWEAGRSRAVLVALVVLAVTTPVATAEIAFHDPGGGGPTYVPGEHTWIAFAERGGAIHDGSFKYTSIYAAPDLPLGHDVAYDVLVLILSPPGASVRSVNIEVKGSDVVRVVDGGKLRIDTDDPAARVPAPQDGQPRSVYRVPVTLRAVTVEELGESPAPVEVHTAFTADGRQFTSVGRMTLNGEVPGAVGQLIVAGLVLPGAALAGFVVRKRNTR